MDLNTTTAKNAVEIKLSKVASALADLDGLYDKAETLESELATLKSQESAILSDSSRTDEAKLPDLLSIRGQIDLKQAAITALHGQSAQSNSIPATFGSIGDAEESVKRSAEIAGEFLTAYHYAVQERFLVNVQEATSSFVREEDQDELFLLAQRHPNTKTISGFLAPVFTPRAFDVGHARNVQNARNLEAFWKSLSAIADTIPGELSVSIPDPWMVE